MSNDLKNLICEAFGPAWRDEPLKNGFRLRAQGVQACAVYFKDNLRGNAVEIGLSPKALAPRMERSEAEIERWVRQQAAVTGRERRKKGLRGSYPVGVAFASKGELEAFLTAWQQFREGDVATPSDLSSPGILDQTPIEKAARNAGFELIPEQQGNWEIFRSKVFPYQLGVSNKSGEIYLIGFSDIAWGMKVATDLSLTVAVNEGPWPARIDGLSGYEVLDHLLQRAVRIGRLLAGEYFERFREESLKLPATTEAERLVLQRIGQNLFRDALIDYWQGRCAVTGLDVVPLLRASHIKPWSSCAADEERLNVFNGLLLAPHLDALFDGGWITFQDDGELVTCAALTDERKKLLGIQSELRIDSLTDEHRGYLAFHRGNVFKI